MRNPLNFLLVFLGLASCQGPIPAAELNTWLEETSNGCMITNKAGEYAMSVQFLPAEMMAYKQFHILEERYNDSAFEALAQEFSKGQHFELTLDFAHNPEGAKSFFDAHQDYMNFYIGDDLRLVSGTDTIPCSIANLERGANFSPKLKYELAFDHSMSQVQDEITLLYEGELSDSLLTFNFLKSDLNQIPPIKR